MVAYVIIQCVVIYCLKVCVNICERVVWYNDYCINTTLEQKCINARANDYLHIWFKHHVEDEREMKTKGKDPFVGGGANYQMALNDGATSTTKKIPYNEWKECHYNFLVIFDFLLYDWRKRKRICFFQLMMHKKLMDELLCIKGEYVGSIFNISPKSLD